MTDIERRDVTELVRALQRVEWVDGRCPWCARSKAYGLHICSCPRRLALRAGARLLGTEMPVEAANGGQDFEALIAHLNEATEGERHFSVGLGLRAVAVLERLTR